MQDYYPIADEKMISITNYKDALIAAQKFIDAKLADGINRPINVIFMTDGVPAENLEGKQEIEEIKKNATVYTIGLALTEKDYKIILGSIVKGHKETVTVIGSQTGIGTSPSKVSSVAINNGNDDATENYAITKEDGVLTVNSRTKRILAVAETPGGGGSSGGGSSKPTEDIPDEQVPLADMSKLNKADHINYILGYPQGDVRPNNNITREEVALIFYRLLNDNYRGTIFTEQENFKDISSKRWYLSAIATLSNGGIFTGYTDGTFKPNQPITRAEAMTLINKVLERRVNVEGLTEGFKTFTDNKSGDWYYFDVIEATNNHKCAERADASSMEKWTEIISPKTWR